MRRTELLDFALDTHGPRPGNLVCGPYPPSAVGRLPRRVLRERSQLELPRVHGPDPISSSSRRHVACSCSSRVHSPFSPVARWSNARPAPKSAISGAAATRYSKLSRMRSTRARAWWRVAGILAESAPSAGPARERWWAAQVGRHGRLPGRRRTRPPEIRRSARDRPGSRRVSCPSHRDQ